MTCSAIAQGSAQRRLGRAHLIAAAAAGLLVAATAAAPVTAAGAPPTSEADAIGVTLSNILELHHAVGEFVGARLAVRDADGTITEVSAGTPTLDPASGPVDPDVPWNIGSATKAFVAVVVLQLAEEGRLDLDAGIDGYLPDLAGAEQITPRQLLNHTSGLGEYLDEALVTDPLRQWTPAELIAIAEAAGRVGEPGGPHHYANTNYIVLAEIIETGHRQPMGRRGTHQDRRTARHDPHRCDRRHGASSRLRTHRRIPRRRHK